MVNDFYYMLDGHIALPVAFEQWCVLPIEDRRVAADWVGDIWVSTVFMGIDTTMCPSKPALFETMVFERGAEDNDDFEPKATRGGWGQIRYSTWEEAEAGHALVVTLVRSSVHDGKESEHDDVG